MSKGSKQCNTTNDSESQHQIRETHVRPLDAQNLHQ